MFINCNKKGYINEDKFVELDKEVRGKRKSAFFGPKSMLIFDACRPHKTDTDLNAIQSQFPAQFDGFND